MDFLTSKYLLPSLLSSEPSHLLLLAWASSAAGSTRCPHRLTWLGEASEESQCKKDSQTRFSFNYKEAQTGKTEPS
jgi:hypothetical protein